MWKSHRGFTLLEVLATLVIWMVIASVLLPGLVRMNQERKGFVLEQQARFILTIELESIRSQEGVFQEKTLNKDGTIYTVTLKEGTIPPTLCVSYSDYQLLVKERCLYVRYQ
ncbi:type II secretion system protein [Bacillus sp. RO1]|uniref:type II secretion system protein n=1 Tax=Bacillus sp. RO1 TaxID=2722703 RepID=UPI00145646A0|nr:type II secretion system protein [Bacillus sp. RO1]NLP50901.1 type II secretion system protein [Bacillus sp. RO1]